MTEGHRKSYRIHMPIGVDAHVVVRNAGGRLSSFSRPGTSAVVYCVDPETGHDFAASVNELRVLAAKRKGMPEAAISEEFGWNKTRAIADTLARLKHRLEKLGWEGELLNRGTMIAIAERLGLLDPRLQNTVTQIIYNQPTHKRSMERSRRSEAGQSETNLSV